MQSALRNFLSQSLRGSQTITRNVFAGATSHAEPRVDSEQAPPALTHLSESEMFLKDTVKRFFQ